MLLLHCCKREKQPFSSCLEPPKGFEGGLSPVNLISGPQGVGEGTLAVNHNYESNHKSDREDYRKRSGQVRV